MSRKSSKRITHKISCRANIEDWNTMLEIQQELQKELGVSDVHQHDVISKVFRHYRETYRAPVAAPQPAPVAALPAPKPVAALPAPQPKEASISIPLPAYSSYVDPRPIYAANAASVAEPRRGYLDLMPPVNYVDITPYAWPRVDSEGRHYLEMKNASVILNKDQWPK